MDLNSQLAKVNLMSNPTEPVTAALDLAFETALRADGRDPAWLSTTMRAFARRMFDAGRRLRAAGDAQKYPEGVVFIDSRDFGDIMHRVQEGGMREDWRYDVLMRMQNALDETAVRAAGDEHGPGKREWFAVPGGPTGLRQLPMMPPHVKTRWRDSLGRRCSRIIMECASDEEADNLAASLTGAEESYNSPATPSKPLPPEVLAMLDRPGSSSASSGPGGQDVSDSPSAGDAEGSR